jgi:uncharacterized repeat protein (TIGR04076 family)
MSQDMKVKLTVMNVPDIGEVTPVPVELNYSGPCPFFKVGEEIIVEGEEKPDGFCILAWNTFWPYIMTLRRGGNYPEFYRKEGKAFACCPDAARPVSFLIERI